MPDPVRPVAPREDELREQVLLDLESRIFYAETSLRALVEAARLFRSKFLAVSPVPWAGSGEEEELTRVDRQSLSERQDLPRKPQPEGSQQPICMFCSGCGWCEGSPAFMCPRCKGTGVN